MQRSRIQVFNKSIESNQQIKYNGLLKKFEEEQKRSLERKDGKNLYMYWLLFPIACVINVYVSMEPHGTTGTIVPQNIA